MISWDSLNSIQRNSDVFMLKPHENVICLLITVIMQYVYTMHFWHIKQTTTEKKIIWNKKISGSLENWKVNLLIAANSIFTTY